MRCKVCNQEMKRSVSFDPDGPGCDVIYSCPSHCGGLKVPVSVERFEPELFNLQLAMMIADYTSKSARDVMRILLSTAKPGEMSIDLGIAEEPLGLPKGFFTKALAYEGDAGDLQPA